jgi:hypothetical protein
VARAYRGAKADDSSAVHFCINPVPPEQAAPYLKQTEVNLAAAPRRSSS